ncbi:MAG TPA: T9SS type A sorting domain-containing protein [Moheibacter sp.]|nr:T9SS type A sorting domain-containing protein [Moheibacter sp.]
MRILLLFILSSLFIQLNAQTAPEIEWEKSYGGSHWDLVGEIVNTSDGGYLIAGSSQSDDGDITINKGGTDFWIIKLNSEGALIWEKSYGGSTHDTAGSVVELSNENGYVIVGDTMSNDGDVTPNDSSVAWWVIRIDLEGNLIWEKTLGGEGYNRANSVIQINDEEIMIAGVSDMEGGDVTVNYGGADFWVVKMDIDGNLIWEKSYGGSGDESPEQIIQTIDGNFLLVGFSNSSDGHISSPQGNDDNDYWVIKIDGEGNLLWEKSYGGSGAGGFMGFGDGANAVVESIDGGFVVVGASSSLDGQVTGNHGGTEDFWIIKIDNTGHLVWEKSYGGFHMDNASAIVQTEEGNFIIAGSSASVDGDITNHHEEWPGREDVWVIEINQDGELLWEKSYGGTAIEFTRDMVLNPEGEIIILAVTYSESGDGDVSQNHGMADIWILKLDREIMGLSEKEIGKIAYYPNPVNDVLYLSFDQSISAISIVDLSGKIVFQQSIGAEKAQIDLTFLSKGIYIVKTQSEGGTQTFKIVKE